MASTENTILDLVKGEIARVASSAYTEDGVSMYDAIRPVSRDETQLNTYLSEAEAYMNARLKGRASEIPFPDSVASAADIAPLVDNLKISYACAEWFRRKYPVKHEEYAAKAKESLERLVVLTKTRKEPTKGGIKL